MNQPDTKAIFFNPEVRTRFQQSLSRWLPDQQVQDLLSETLISPFSVPLDAGEFSLIHQQAQDLVSGLWELRNSPVWQSKNQVSGNPRSSVCMSADVHWSGQNLQLIEINTNAAFLALGFVLSEAWGVPQPRWEERILNMFRKSCGRDFNTIAIVDENPSQQKLFIEFLLYQKIFRSFGKSCDILDAQEDLHSYDVIYNRSTDFLLSNSPQLKAAELSPTICVTPGPHDYVLLARKSNLNLFSEPHIWTELQLSPPSELALKSHLLESQQLSSKNAEQLWKDRKKWFFKPAQSFGSKQAYRGASISWKLFETLIGQGFVSQRFVPAPEVSISPTEKLKWDARIFFFEDQLQLILVRLYQGQVTNANTPNGGWSILLKK